MDESPLNVEPLGPHHDRASFSSGEPSLDAYIRRQASQDARRRVARVFVASGDPPERIAGYCTPSAAGFENDNLPAEVARRLPHYPVPAAVIGRLAVDLRSQEDGLGEVLLLDAIHRAVRAGDTIGIHAVVVDCCTTAPAPSMNGTASCPSRRDRCASICRFERSINPGCSVLLRLPAQHAVGPGSGNHRFPQRLNDKQAHDDQFGWTAFCEAVADKRRSCRHDQTPPIKGLHNIASCMPSAMLYSDSPCDRCRVSKPLRALVIGAGAPLRG